VLIVGEVHTGLLRGRGPVTGDLAHRLVDLVRGERVLVSERPMAYVRSPNRPVGVDCPLTPPGPARRVRGVGTAIQRSTITGGHVLQGSAHATVVRGEHGARQPWSYYLAQPGVIEALGRTRWSELAESLAAPQAASDELDLGAVAERAADEVQRRAADSPQRTGRPDGSTRLRSARTRLRWIAQVDPAETGPPRVQFAVHGDHQRLLRITVADADADGLAATGEDLALHDWLLTTLIEVVRRAAIGIVPRSEAIERLMPAIDHILHLWMPRARPHALTDRVWQVLDDTPGFTRQWQTLVNRVRDQLSAAAVVALSTAKQS
jgi:hypothetical protein